MLRAHHFSKVLAGPLDPPQNVRFATALAYIS